MLDQVKMSQDMREALQVIFDKAKHYDPKLDEDIFLQVIIKQWLDQYRLASGDILKRDEVVLKNDLKMAFLLSGQNQKQTAAAIGVHRSYLSQIISGDYEPSITLVLLLIRALNWPASKITDLFFLEKK